MAFTTSILRSLAGLLLLIAVTDALKFDLQAHSHPDKTSERCIRNFVSRDTLVVVTATLSGYKGDGMIVNMHVGIADGGQSAPY
jgi:hypothetical protein